MSRNLHIPLARTLFGALTLASLTVWGGQTMPVDPQELAQLRQAVAAKKKENEELARRVAEMEAQLKEKARLTEQKDRRVEALRRKLDRQAGDQGQEPPSR